MTKVASSNEAKDINASVLVIEEVMFWSGLLALIVGGGWVSIAGGVLVLASIVFAIILFAYGK